MQVRGASTVQVRAKTHRHVSTVVELHEPQVQFSRRGVRVRPCECPPRRSDHSGGQTQGEVKAPGDGRRAQEGDLDALGVGFGIGWPYGKRSWHGVFDIVLRGAAGGALSSRDCELYRATIRSVALAPGTPHGHARNQNFTL